MTKTILFLLLSILFFSCKKTTSNQVLFYNDSVEQLKVKVYSHLPLTKDSFVINSYSNYEVFYKVEDGFNQPYDCTASVDSIITYSSTNKMKVDISSNQTLTQESNLESSQHKYACIFSIGKGDTIK